MLVTPMSHSLQAHTLLVVDDHPENVGILFKILSRHGFLVLVAEDGESALHIASNNAVDLILLDIMMPGIGGFETCERLKNHPQTQDIPVIFMSALQDTVDKIKGFKAGAVDYITKPFEMEEVLMRINTHLTLHHLRAELEQKNQALQAVVNQQQAVLDNSPVGILFLDGDRYIRQVNFQAAGMMGYAPDELIGKSVEIFYPCREQYEKVGREAYPLLCQGGAYETEQLFKRRDGTSFWGKIRGKAVNMEDLKQGFVWNLEDITHARQTEEELRLAAKVFENINDAVFITDENNRIITVNPAFCNTTGYSREEVLGHDPEILGSGRHDRDFYRRMWQELLHDNQWQGEVWNRRENGTVYLSWLSISVIRQADGEISHFVAVLSDITKRKEMEEQLRRQANYDPLTHLPNRILFHDRLRGALARAHRQGKEMALLYVDLDGFKQINDQFGHGVGDQVLIEAANRLRETVREDDTAARLGGDEFAVILNELDKMDYPHSVARRITEQLAMTVNMENGGLAISASVGLALYPRDAGDEEALLQKADQAMYKAKQQGKNTYCRAEGAALETEQESRPPAKPDPVPPRPVIDSGNPPLRVLYVEDDAYFGNLVKMILEQENYRVDVVSNGSSALELTHSQMYDLILLDYILEDTTGLELLNRFIHRNPELPIILITGEGDEGVAVEAMKRGAADYLRKDGDFLGLLSSAVHRALNNRELSEARRQMNEARQREELYHRIFDSAFVALFILNPQGYIVEVNETACTLFEYSHEELTRLHGKALLHPDSYPLFNRLMDTGQPFSGEMPVLSKSGAKLYVEASRDVVVYHGKPHLLAIVRDITERWRAQERLRWVATAFEHASEAVMITDVECHILAVNQAFAEITGYAEEEVIGRNPNLLKSGRHKPEFYQELWYALNTFGAWRGEIQNRRKNGDLFLAWQDISTVRDREGNISHYISIFMDMTQTPPAARAESRIGHNGGRAGA